MMYRFHRGAARRSTVATATAGGASPTAQSPPSLLVTGLPARVTGRPAQVDKCAVCDVCVPHIDVHRKRIAAVEHGERQPVVAQQRVDHECLPHSAARSKPAGQLSGGVPLARGTTT